MKAVKTAGIVVFSIVVIAQFVRPDRSAGPAGSDTALAARFPVPSDVQDILTVACFDCHSNGTRYPWYSEIQPVGWWIQDHITDGRRHLNFDEFLSYPTWRQYRKLQEIESEVREESMPLDSYLPMHADARLTPDQRRLITGWAISLRDSMQAWYPSDSLQRRRPPEPQQTETKENS